MVRLAIFALAISCVVSTARAQTHEPETTKPFVSPIHFRPTNGLLCDTIPFFWKGEYHIFYLRLAVGGGGRIPWEHIVSTDLVHWRELPRALASDGDPNGPDGDNMFTGCVLEREGTFHIFYTGSNHRNPQGRELVMHATSPDLIQWTKHPEDMLAPDGIHYANRQDSDFRDPYVCWDDETKEYWMVLCANSLNGAKEAGLAVSNDLKNWRQMPPLHAPNQECPDLFKIGDIWYLIGGDTYSFSKDLRGEFQKPPVQNVIDRPGIYAGKRMYDGKRHIWTGWVWDGDGRDGSEITWGGTQCLPRELYAGPNGQLYQRPVEEATNVFTKKVLEIGEPRQIGAGLALPTPDHYMLQCSLQLDPQAATTITLRQQLDGTGGYNIVLRPASQEAELNGPRFCYKRSCTLDTAKPVKFQAFVQGTIVECFINDQFAYTSRAYNFPQGMLGFKVDGGISSILELVVRIHDDAPSDTAKCP